MNTLRLIGVLLFVSLLVSPAEARKQATAAHPDCNILFPCLDVAPSARGERVVKAMGGFGTAKPVYERRSEITHGRGRQADLGPISGQPSRYIGGRLVCALNVNAALAERGIKGTGSALAKSFLHWGRSAGGPVPGAVIVSSRRGGGHVAIVSRVVDGQVYAWNATGGRRGWREVLYRKAVLDYRVPG